MSSNSAKTTISDSSTSGDNNGNASHLDKSTMITLKLVYFFYYASVSSINPFLSLYYNSIGLENKTIGTLAAINLMTLFIVTPIWGFLADKTGARSSILMIAVAVSASVRTCFLLPATQNIWVLTLVLIFYSIFYAPIKSLTDSVVMSFLPQGEKSKFGKIREWGPAGKIISSPLMAYVISNSNHGFKIAFTTSALFAMPVILCTFNLKPVHPSAVIKSNTSTSPKRLSILDTFRLVLKNKALLYFFSFMILLGSTFGFIEAFVYVHMRQIFNANLNNASFNLTFSFCRVCMAFGGFMGFRISTWFLKKVGPKLSIYVCLLCISICYFIYSACARLTMNVWIVQLLLFIAELIRAAFFSVMWSVATVHVNTISPPKMTSSALAFMDSVYAGLGKSFGSMFGGRLIAATGGIAPAFTFVGSITFTIACMLCYLDLHEKIIGREVTNEKKDS